MTELVGEGKPFHSAVDKAAGMLKRKVGTGAEFMKELMGVTGIKPTELQERGLTEIMGMPRMTHDQFMANLSIRPAPKIREKVLGGDQDDPNWIGPYHYQWTLPGGENYREMLIKAPAGIDNQEKIMDLESKLRRAPVTNNEEQKQWDSLYNQIKDLRAQEMASPKEFEGVGAHFGGEKNILASMRLKDRFKAQPPEIRHIAINKKSGFPSQDFATPEELDAYIKTLPENIQNSLVKKQVQIAKPLLKLLHLEELQSDWHQQGREHGYDNVKPIKTTNPDGTVTVDFGNNQKTTFQNDLYADDAIHTATIKNKKSVPDAPFKKNWEEMAIKRLIHHAAQKGYHGIVVTSGQEQADRYGLAKHVDALKWHPESNQLAGIKDGRAIFNQSDVNENNLANYVGKEVAQKLIKSPKEKQPLGNSMYHVISGDDLQVGGEGMKGFYDKKVPNIFNAVGKKHGVKMQLHAHPMKTEREKMVPDNSGLGMIRSGNPEYAQVHHFPITEEMRKDVLKNGLPLYNTGGVIHKAKGGKVKGPQPLLPKETVKAYKLFRVDQKQPGKLFPLFVDANTPVEKDKWVEAKVGEMTGNKVKSKIGPLAYRPGWHAGDLPVATHIGEKSDNSLTAPDRRPKNQVWAEVEMPNDVDWQSEANRRGTNKQGKLIPVKAHITDQIPLGGHYRYKTNPNMTGNWLIGGAMKVNRVLPDEEVKKINKKAKVSDLPRSEPINLKDYGFRSGGNVQPLLPKFKE